MSRSPVWPSSPRQSSRSARARTGASVTTTTSSSRGVEILAPVEGRAAGILTSEALDFVASLQRSFGPCRRELLARRAARRAELAAGTLPDFLPETAGIRAGDWQVAPTHKLP